MTAKFKERYRFWKLLRKKNIALCFSQTFEALYITQPVDEYIICFHQYSIIDSNSYAIKSRDTESFKSNDRYAVCLNRLNKIGRECKF